MARPSAELRKLFMNESVKIISKDPETEARLKRVVQRIFDLPSFPSVIQKLQEVAENPKSTSKQLAAVMEKDQGLSVKILKLVNSAFYSFSKPVSSLQHAITLLGYNSIRSLALSVSVKGLLKVDEKIFNSQHFWEHALAVGTGTRHLADLNRFAMKDDAFTAGLMHDVGLLLEAKYFQEELASVTQAAAADGVSLSEAEMDQLGVDHCLLGGWLAEKWRLPPLLAEPMLQHHTLVDQAWTDEEKEALDEDLIRITEFVTVANIIATSIGLGHGLGVEERICIDPAAIEIPDHLKHVLCDKDLQELSDEFQQKFEDSKSFLTV